jgi:cytochrome c-type biogenesis protein CcmF
MLGDFIVAVKRRRKSFSDEGILISVQRTVMRNRRYYGGMIVHFGIAVIAIGLTGSGLFRSESSVLMKPGDVVEVGGYHLRFEGTRRFSKDNYLALQGKLVNEDDGIVLTPERRTYPAQQQPTTESSLDSNLWRDVYVVIGEQVKGSWGIHVYVNPLVQFIWLGGMIAVLGVIFSLSQRVRERQGARVRKSSKAAAGV